MLDPIVHKLFRMLGTTRQVPRIECPCSRIEHADGPRTRRLRAAPAGGACGWPADTDLAFAAARERAVCPQKCVVRVLRAKPKHLWTDVPVVHK